MRAADVEHAASPHLIEVQREPGQVLRFLLPLVPVVARRRIANGLRGPPQLPAAVALALRGVRHAPWVLSCIFMYVHMSIYRCVCIYIDI